MKVTSHQLQREAHCWLAILLHPSPAAQLPPTQGNAFSQRRAANPAQRHLHHQLPPAESLRAHPNLGFVQHSIWLVHFYYICLYLSQDFEVLFVFKAFVFHQWIVQESFPWKATETSLPPFLSQQVFPSQWRQTQAQRPFRVPDNCDVTLNCILNPKARGDHFTSTLGKKIHLFC